MTGQQAPPTLRRQQELLPSASFVAPSGKMRVELPPI